MKRGLTLVEVLVAAGIALVILLLLSKVLISIVRSSNSAVENLELSQVGQALSQRIIDDLQTAPRQAIRLPGAHRLFSIQSLERTTATGKPIYSPNLLVYWVELDKGRLSRRICRPAALPLDRPSLLEPGQLTLEFQRSSEPTRILVGGLLKKFQLWRPTPERADLLELSFELQLNSKIHQHTEVVALRNGDL